MIDEELRYHGDTLSEKLRAWAESIEDHSGDRDSEQIVLLRAAANLAERVEMLEASAEEKAILMVRDICEMEPDYGPDTDDTIRTNIDALTLVIRRGLGIDD